MRNLETSIGKNLENISRFCLKVMKLENQYKRIQNMYSSKPKQKRN